MALLDLLSSLIGQQGNTATPVEGVAVPGRRQPPPQAPIARTASMSEALMPPPDIPGQSSQGTDAAPARSPLNYDNSADIQALNGAMGANQPRGGSANPGIYGFLPHGMQHGTLRNVLGALGDAFLVGANRPAQYGPRMDRQEIGNALAGYNPDDPQSIQAAIQRVAATGADGSTEMADRMVKNANDSALRRATMEQTSLYHQSMTDSRHDTAIQRLIPQIGGMMSSARNPEEYAARYAQAEAIAQRIGPDYHASDFGLLSPTDWQPGLSPQGMTGNNQQVSADKASQRETSRRNTDVIAGSRIASANISANRPGDARRREQLGPRIDDGTATPAEQQEWAHLTQVARQGRGRRSLPSGSVSGSVGITPEATGAALGSALMSPSSQFQNGKIYRDKHGNQARYQDGHWVPIH